MLEAHFNVFLRENKLKLLSIRSFKNGKLWECIKTEFFGACLKCGSTKVVKAGKCSTTVREEPLREKPVWLKIHKHRVYCKDCKKTSTEPVDGIWPRRRSTQRFRKFIAKKCGTMSDISTVSAFESVSFGFVHKVYYEQAAIKLKEYQSASHWPTTLGIDEHFFRRTMGFTEFVTLFTDLNKKRVFELALGKDNKSLLEQLLHIPGRLNVKLVVIDMSSSYKALVKKLFPNAEIIADKFHVMRLFTPHIMKAGKEIHGHRQELKTRRKLLCSRKKLDYFVRYDIDQYLKQHTDLNELYRWKERLFEIYRMKGFNRAKKAFNKMLHQMSQSKLEAVQKVFRTFKRWKNEILRYFKFGYTNAYTERMNGTGKLVQRRAFGYKNFKNYRLRFLSVLPDT
ncbi:MAG: ISL3 family transposase [Bdellovibrionales bacterium]|nr:ISL3 family transposase [Bdellovibrionales bacterium]